VKSLVKKAKVVRVQNLLDVDELIGETRKCRGKVELCLQAGGMLQPIASYTRTDFLSRLKNFRKGLEAPNWQREELKLVLNIDKAMVEFRAKPRP
jgi:hypothetical protein